MLALVKRPDGRRSEIWEGRVFGMRVLVAEPAAVRGEARREKQRARMAQRLVALGARSQLAQLGAAALPGLADAADARLLAEFAPQILRSTAPPESTIALYSPRYCALTARLVRELCADFRRLMLSMEHMPPGLGERLLDSLGAAVTLSPGRERLGAADYGIILGPRRTQIISRAGEALAGFGFEAVSGETPPEGFDAGVLMSAALECGALERRDIRLVKIPAVTRA